MTGQKSSASLAPVSMTLQAVAADAATSPRLWMACVGEIARMLVTFCPKVAEISIPGVLACIASLQVAIEHADHPYHPSEATTGAYIGAWTNLCVFACSLTDMPAGFAAAAYRHGLFSVSISLFHLKSFFF